MARRSTATYRRKAARDRDTVAFLLETQTKFYRDTIGYLRRLGFKGLITASNWAMASPEVFGPLEKLSYTTGDFIDRHGYFDCNHKGENAAWSVRDGHTYSDGSALRFEASDPTKPQQFVHPVMDPHYDRKPSMISETTFCRPNRYRSEAPLYYAAYGALQDSDAIVHFAFDGGHWAVKPGFWMQQWTLTTPAMMGQFPATALLYRRGLVRPGQVLADVKLNRRDLSIRSDLELGHILAVALDDQPLATSRRILLQVMSEERETNRQIEPVNATVKRILEIGVDPWQVRTLNGTVRFKRADAVQLMVTALDFNGVPSGPAGTAQEIQLRPTTLYYLIAS